MENLYAGVTFFSELGHCIVSNNSNYEAMVQQILAAIDESPSLGPDVLLPFDIVALIDNRELIL